MTALQALELARAQLASIGPRRAMVRVSRHPSALLVCDALDSEAFLQAQGWRVMRRPTLLWLDLPESAYHDLAAAPVQWPDGPWHSRWALEQAFLAHEIRRTAPWRGERSIALIRQALLAASTSPTLPRLVSTLRAASALALRSGGDAGVAAAAKQAAQAFWHTYQVGSPPPGGTAPWTPA